MANRQMWEIEVRHGGLNKYRHIRGSDRYVVEQKAAAQEQAWDQIWKKKREREAAIRSKEDIERTINCLVKAGKSTTSSFIQWRRSR